MAWKAERWLKDIFPGTENIYAEYHKLPRRELAIVGPAVLDAALAELIYRRLRDDSNEAEDFLGVSGDSRAVCASFGARIQMAYLLGILTKEDAIILRLLKNVRNQLAHRVNADFNSSEVLPLITSLLDRFMHSANRLKETDPERDTNNLKITIGPHLASTPEAGAGFFLAVFCCYHAYLHRLSGRLFRIGDCIKTEATSSEPGKTK